MTPIRPQQWKPGQSGNPAGRPKGARNKLSETFLEDFYKQWQEGGADALKEMREKDPSGFVKVAASILPREAKLELGLSAQLAEFLENIQRDPPRIVNGEAAEILDPD